MDKHDWHNLVGTLSCGCMVLDSGSPSDPVVDYCKFHRQYDSDDAFKVMRTLSKDELVTTLILKESDFLRLELRFAILKHLGYDPGDELTGDDGEDSLP